ncbi:hypothetical protein [Nocardia abscessus]|uniref:hypothetical protein n=1 Tax=Nocardia abscessus TaxID=120957 RepID=UPI002458F36B|nr:hypothetical protein [Nocardia abscessus]
MLAVISASACGAGCWGARVWGGGGRRAPEYDGRGARGAGAAARGGRPPPPPPPARAAGARGRPPPPPPRAPQRRMLGLASLETGS